MAYIINTHSTPIRTFLAVAAAALTERLHRHSLYRQTLVELSRLSDRELTDIGVSRGSIEDIAREHAYGK